MIDCVIAFDEKDTELGAYFLACKENLASFLEEQQISNLVEIPANRCNQVYMQHKIEHATKPFIFVAYSHGLENALVCQGEGYVKANENTSLFTQSVFYTNACLSGKILANDLIDNGCLCYIGYEESINVLLANPGISIKCDNYGIMLFVGGNLTIYEAFQAMKKYYTSESEKLSFVDAAELTYARDSLVFLGNKELKFTQLFT
jgi:hypothetical protein